MSIQDLATTVAFEQAETEGRRLLQIAGLRPLSVHTAGCATPGEYTRLVMRLLQQTLPRNARVSVRADGSCLQDPEFAKHAAAVEAAVIESAHASPTLRPVIERDRSGREVTSFYGQKKSWMAAYAAPVMLATKIDGQPVRLPVIIS